MAGTISQRITLEGQDEVRKAFEQLSAAVDKLSPQFRQLTTATQAFGTAGTQASQQVANGLNQTTAAAEKTGAALISAATMFAIAAVGIATTISAMVRSLTSGTGETARQISAQADKLGLTTAQWIGLRRSIDAAQGSVQEFASSVEPLLKNLNQLTAQFSGRSIQTFGDGTQVTTIQMRELSAEAKKLLDVLEKFGVRRDIIDKGSIAIMQELARIIDGMPEGTAKAAAGLQFFGEKWRGTVEALVAGYKAVGDAEAEMDNKRRASRELTEDQVKAAKQAADQWDDLGRAIRATKDAIGAMFSGSSFARAKWLTELVDDSRELLKTWGRLGEAARAAFLADMGDSPAENVFKTMIALGQHLSGVWDVLVSAGEKLMGIIGGIAGMFEGITGSQVAAFFITAAIAATALALALKGLGFLLTPVTLLLSLFSPFGAVLLAAGAAALVFWEQISEGASKAAALIPEELAQMGEAIKKLFAGDYKGFWEQFSAAAVSAFQKISEGISQAISQTPWAKTLLDGVKQIGEEAPGAIKLVVDALAALGGAATTVANALNFIFGTDKFSATGIVLLTVIASMTGGLAALAAAVGITAGALVILSTSIGLVGTALRGLAIAAAPLAAFFATPFGLAVIAVLALAAALVLLIRYWPEIKEAAVVAWGAIKEKAAEVQRFIEEWVTTPVGNAWQWIVDTFNSAVGFFSTKIDEVKSLIEEWVTTPVANAWQWIVDKWNAMLKKLGFGGEGGEGGEVTEGVPGNARGGLIGGRGTGTSDSNLSWVSRGEHIMPARAVRQPGVLAFLEALRRSGGNLRSVLDGMGRFASGGLVSMPAMATAGGGGTAGRDWGTISLQLSDGTKVRGGVERAVFDALSSAATTRRMTATGKKPGFVA